MHKVALEETDPTFLALVKEALEGTEVVITQDNKPIVKLVSLLEKKPIPKFGSAKGLITISDDFDEPLEDFQGGADYAIGRLF